MAERVRIELRPLGRSIDVERGMELRDVLYDLGVEFPCGGKGQCKRCRVQLLEGELAPSDAELQFLSAEERDAGWRMACRGRVQGPLTLKVEQHEAEILGDRSRLDFEPMTGLGVAVDLGTTTLVAQLVDLATGRILASESALNPQVAYGSDIMHRLQFALDGAGGSKLVTLIREAVGGLVARALESGARTHADESPLAALNRVVVVGNTAMHHLFSALEVERLARYPFESEHSGLQEFSADELAWRIGADVPVRVLPCFGGFVGSDILAGILATRMHEDAALTALIDLGTNGEIVIGSSERLICASTAAGPAFEAGGIEQGMRAVHGAIDQVDVGERDVRCHVVGGGEARGICGSGVVDAVAAALELGWLEPSGRLATGHARIPLAGAVHVSQADVRQLQLAKGAIAAGVRILLTLLGKSASDLQRIHLAGAFGNYIDHASAERIGLMPRDAGPAKAVGNSALLGAKLALFTADDSGWEFSELRERVEHVPLAASPDFQQIFVEELQFPDSLSP